MAAPVLSSIDVTPSGKNLNIVVKGSIDETVKFPFLKCDGQVHIDVAGVKMINSIGTRAWCLWLQRFPKPATIVLSGCPVIMVKNFSLIKGFLTDNCKVFSFVIPFYSEVTGERHDFLATWGQHFDSKGKLKLPQMLDSKKMPMVVDVVEETYFAFLKK